MKLVPAVIASLVPAATASTAQAQTPAPQFPSTQPTYLAQGAQLPASIANAVLQQHARLTGRPPYAFRIAGASPVTWPDGCLGLASSTEFCTQVQVSGWRVTLADDLEQWVYRTDASGVAVRSESGRIPVVPSNNFPTSGSPPLPNPVNPSPVPPSPAQGWNAELRWSRIVDSQDPEVLFQLSVLQKPETRYANVVYQFYAREKGKTGWTYLYTTLGARLLNNGAGSVELPLESLRLGEVAQKMGYEFNWDRTDIRVSVLIRYDLSKTQRDLRLRFQHESTYASIAPLSLAQLHRGDPSPTPSYGNSYGNPYGNSYGVPPGAIPATAPVPQNPGGYRPPYTPISYPAYPGNPTIPPGVPSLPPLQTPYPYMN